MNESLADMNENDMFVTFFLGVLDLSDGHLRYCNAGHNAPVHLGNGSGGFLEVVPNLPLGVMPGMEYEEQETTFSCGEGLFLYTDGLTEAENVRHQLFGTEKMLETALAADGKPAGELVDAMKDAVKSHIQGCEPSDDLTMLAVRYTNPSLSDAWERRVTLREVSEIPRLQRFMQAVSEHADLDHALSLNLNLALEEAVSNVLLYAYPGEAEKKVDLKALVWEDRIDFTVSDSGIPFDPTAIPAPDLSVDLKDRPIGGLGIFLVKRIMDDVSYRREDGKNILTMTKKR